MLQKCSISKTLRLLKFEIPSVGGNINVGDGYKPFVLVTDFSH